MINRNLGEILCFDCIGLSVKMKNKEKGEMIFNIKIVKGE